MQARFPIQIVGLAAALGFAAGVGSTHYWVGSRASDAGSVTSTDRQPASIATMPPVAIMTQVDTSTTPRPVSPLPSQGTPSRAAVEKSLSDAEAGPLEGMEVLVGRARHDPEAREHLFRSFLSTQGDERGVWLSALRRLKGDDVKSFALDSLNDSDPSVRMSAYQMLQDYAPNDVALQSMLVRQVSGESEPAARLTLLESVAPAQLAAGDRQSARLALEALASEADPQTRAAALGLLAHRYLEGAERNQWLDAGLEDPDARVRTSALASLWTTGSAGIQQWERIRDIATNPHESWAVRDAALALVEREGSPYAGDRWVAGTRGVLDNQFAGTENAPN